MRRGILLLTVIAATLVLASGMALAVTKIGGPGPDTLRGTNGADNFLGNGGNDVLFALGGNNNNLLGGEGKDWVLGGDERRPFGGDKNLAGGPGNDGLYGGLGSDKVVGGPGNDFLGGDHGSDTVVGQEGREVVDSGLGSDRIAGGEGPDWLVDGPLVLQCHFHAKLGSVTLLASIGAPLLCAAKGLPAAISRSGSRLSAMNRIPPVTRAKRRRPSAPTGSRPTPPGAHAIADRSVRSRAKAAAGVPIPRR